jgi:nickel-dependent lactate racemase
VLNIARYLREVQGFKKENVTILMDDGKHRAPTKSEILKAYKKVVKESVDGDVVFCHYSGHGGRVVDDNGDEGRDIMQTCISYCHWYRECLR